MKQTRGFVTDDGTFFESEWEAALYEAEFRLRSSLTETFPNLNQEPFFTILLSLKRPILEYLNAHSTANATKPVSSESEVGDEVEVREPPEVDEHPAVINSAEEDFASLLKLPTRRLSHVPNVRSGTQPEEVSDRSPLDGP